MEPVISGTSATFGADVPSGVAFAVTASAFAKITEDRIALRRLDLADPERPDAGSRLDLRSGSACALSWLTNSGGMGGGRGWKSARWEIGFGRTMLFATTTCAPTLVMENSLGAKE